MHKPYSKDINYQISNFGHLQANSKEKKKTTQIKEEIKFT